MALQFSNIRLITIIEIKLFIKLAPNVRASAIVMNVINKTLLSDINIKKKTKKNVLMNSVTFLFIESLARTRRPCPAGRARPRHKRF